MCAIPKVLVDRNKYNVSVKKILNGFILIDEIFCLNDEADFTIYYKTSDEVVEHIKKQIEKLV